MIFFEIPVGLFILVLFAILGIEIGPALVTLGIIFSLIGLISVWANDDDTKLASFFLLVLPNIILIIIGASLGDASLFQLLF